jgi:hypothetical protein
MLNGWRTLLGIFGVLFVVSIALGQPQSSPNSSNPTSSQSESVTIIREIHAAELRTRDHIDKKSTELSKEISKLKTEEISELKTNLALLKAEVSNLKWWLVILTTLVLLPLVFPSLKQAWQKWGKRGGTEGGPSSSFRQIQDFATRGGFSGTPRSENRDSAEGS